MIKELAAILFLVGEEGVSLKTLAQTLDQDPAAIKEGIQALKAKLEAWPDSPVKLVRFGDHYQLITHSELAGLVERFAQSPLQQKLTRAAIETLAIVAYRQPITRMSVDEIRGVSSQAMLQKLVGRDLIQEVGRIDGPGRPVLYGVTDYFLNYFGLKSLEDLPPIEELALNSQTTSEALFDVKQWEVQLFDEEA